MTNYCPMCVASELKRFKLWLEEEIKTTMSIHRRERFRFAHIAVAEYELTGLIQNQPPATVDAIDTSEKRVEEPAGNRHDHLHGVSKKDGAE